MTHLTFFLLVVAAAASARLTRLVVADTIFDGPRGWVMDRIKPGTKPAELLGCPWCVSAYVTVVIWAIVWHLHPLPLPFLCWFAIWWMACFAYWACELLFEAAVQER